jgi:hypothetical protein
VYEQVVLVVYPVPATLTVTVLLFVLGFVIVKLPLVPVLGAIANDAGLTVACETVGVTVTELPRLESEFP